METEDKDKEYANALYENISDTIGKDDVSFDTKITYISFGAMAMFLTYITSKDSAFIYLWMGVTGCTAFLLCIFCNMSSYLFGKITMRRNLDTLRNYIENSVPVNNLYDMASSINRKVDTWNWVSYFFLFFGAIFTIIFIFINI